MLLLSSFLLLSCQSQNAKLEQAKLDLLSGEDVISSSGMEESDMQQKTQTGMTATGEELPAIEIENAPWAFLEFAEIDPELLQTGEVEIKGTTLWNVERIEVNFSNATSSYPPDSYTLKTFQAWSWSFRYIASSMNQVLDFWENIYLFRAYSGSEMREARVILRVPKSELQASTGALVSSSSIDGLPQNASYGDPQKISETQIWYSGLSGLILEKKQVPAFWCEILPDFLEANMKTWYFWNTCRDIVPGKGISFSLIRIEGEKYVYEKHFLDFSHNWYATLELETWTGVTKDNIEEKNTQLKEKEYVPVWVVLSLMKEIINLP